MLYEFKINLEPTILKLYAGEGRNHDKGMSQIKQELIPALFKKIFPQTKEIKENWIEVNSNDSINILETDAYRSFKNANRILTDEYFNVVNEYNKTRSIQYSSDFLNVTKPRAKESIDALVHEYPEINLAFDYPSKDFSVDLNKDVGHGRTYIINSRKIDQYLNKNPYSVNLRVYYNLGNERILVEAENDEHANGVALTLKKKIGRAHV